MKFLGFLFIFFGFISCYTEETIYPNQIGYIGNISLYMQPDQFDEILSSRKVTLDFEELPQMFINGYDIGLSKFGTRGESTLKFQRKSFAINVTDKFTLDADHSIIDEFKLISMVYDYTYIENRIGTELMRRFEMWPLVSMYTTVYINDSCQGLYYFIEDPENYFLKNRNYDCLLRRHYKSGYKYLINKSSEDDSVFLSRYQNIYYLINQYSGKELYERLNAVINLYSYFKFISLNTLLGNGDYTDEVFFYTRVVNDSILPFEVLPWDLDDIFSSKPHEVGNNWGVGNSFGLRTYSSQSDIVADIGNRLLFSVEEDLDYVIAKDDYLYNEYLLVLSDILNDISINDLISLVNETYQLLLPYYKNADVVYQSQFDVSYTSIDRLQLNVLDKKDYLINRRDSLIQQVNVQLRKK